MPFSKRPRPTTHWGYNQAVRPPKGSQSGGVKHKVGEIDDIDLYDSGMKSEMVPVFTQTKKTVTSPNGTVTVVETVCVIFIKQPPTPPYYN